MKSIATEVQDNLEPLLELNQDFRIIPVIGKFSERNSVAITWRWPRMRDGDVTSVVSTTVFNARKMHKLRVEEIDGLYFLINEPTSDYDKETRLCIANERVGTDMIRALIGFITESDLIDEGEVLGIPAWLSHWNKVAEHLLPLAGVAFFITVSLAALVWVLFS